MKRYMTMLLVLCLGVAASWAQSFNFLNFVDPDDEITQIATDGLVIKFSDGNLVATAGNKTITLDVSGLSHMEFTNVQKADDTYPTGDVDGNGQVEIDDLNILINIILRKDSAENYEGRAYVTGQGTVDIVDVNTVGNIIMHIN